MFDKDDRGDGVGRPQPADAPEEMPSPPAEDGYGVCSTEALLEAAEQLHALQVAALREWLAVVAVLDRREAWKADGATDAVGWVMQRFGASRRTAREQVRVAHALAGLPAIASVVADGALGWDQTRHLTAFATPATDTALALDAPGWSAAQLEVMARRSRPLDPFAVAEAERCRSLRARWSTDRTRLRLTAVWPAADGASVLAALDRLVDQTPADPASGRYDPLDARRADALVELAATRRHDDPDPDRATIVVHIDANALAGATDAPAELEDGPTIATETARRLACDARIQPVVDNPIGAPIGVGRTRRSVPAWLLRQLRRRDNTTCRFPGCARHLHLHAHHVHHWAQGGLTNLDNLVLLCHHHHKLVHERGWHLHLDPNGIAIFTTPDGRTVTSHPPHLRSDLRPRLPLPGALPDTG